MPKQYKPFILDYFQCKEILKRSYDIQLLHSKLDNCYTVGFFNSSTIPYRHRTLFNAFITGCEMSIKPDKPDTYKNYLPSLRKVN